MLGAAQLAGHLKQLPVRRLGAILLLLSGIWTASAPWLVQHAHERDSIHGQLTVTNPLKPDTQEDSAQNGQPASHIHPYP